MGNVTNLFNPFVGLRAFEEDEDYLFFGRTAEINDLLKKFSGSRFLAVIGSSGSGKSSLVKSGLLPAIHSGFLSSGHNWHVALMRPGNQPISNLAEALSKAGVLYAKEATTDGIPYQPIIESTLRRSGNGLMQAYKQSTIFSAENAKANKPQTENLLIIVDQFEELFRFSNYEKEKGQGESQALNFINLLLSATEEAQQKENAEEAEKSRLPIYVLLTMRSDFLGDCSQFRGLPEAINKGQYLVPRMTRDEVKEAITGPVAIGDAQITQSLITRLLNDVGNDIDQLPILQHAMMRTWDEWAKRNQPTDPINIEDYAKTGGMSTALSKHANEIYDELKTDAYKKYCELMFKSLTDKAADVRGTRRPRSINDLNVLTNAPIANIIEIVEQFRKPGRTFLMPANNIPLDGNSIIDISHESLMRVWDKLKSWTEEEAINADIFKRLAEDAKREANGNGSLWINPELEIGLKWRDKFNNNQERLTIWAKAFNLDLNQALQFLSKSETTAIALIKEKEQLIKEEKERDLAEAKRIKEEERKEQQRKDDEAKRKRRLTFAFLILTVGALIVFAILGYRANQSAIAAEKAKGEAVLQRDKAFTSDSLAQLAAAKAMLSDSIAQIEKNKALLSDSLAKIDAANARRSDSLAQIAANDAIQKTKEVLAQKEITDSLAKKSAAAQYQKLIRNFTTDEYLIKKDPNLSYKLVAYCNQLETLKKLNVDGADLINYELYDKLYFCLKNLDACPVTIGDANDKAAATDSNAILKSFNERYHPIAILNDWNEKVIIYSTLNNEIYVLNYKSATDTSVLKSTRIPMAGQVTALGYFADAGIIYFGLKTGEIGYINFKKDAKNQPIYRNDLGSRITAGQFFSKDNQYYFLTTSYMGKAVVYELGNASDVASKLVPNKKLQGIEMPDYFGTINKAVYLKDKKYVVLLTSKGVYNWNPFTEQQLSKLKKLLDANQLQIVQNNSKLY